MVDPVSRRCFVIALSSIGASLAAGSARGADTPGRALDAPVLLVLGDSLSAEYGISRGSGWVALLEKRLATERRTVRVANASVSGETTSGGRARLPALLQRHAPRWVVVALGANDALRGFPLDAIEANLRAMVGAVRASGARPMLVGIRIPSNYGRDYAERFAAVFERVARAERVPLAPFLLAGVADAPDADRLFQEDRLHPNAQAQPRMLENVWPALLQLPDFPRR